MLCSCPLGVSLADIPSFNCPDTFGQIQKVAFQRLRKPDGTRNSFTQTADITKLASWTPLLSAKDSSKIVVSPFIEAPTAEGGAARTFGGGNDTLGGVEEIVGREATPFTAVVRKAPQNVIKALKALQCESWGNNLGIFLFDEHGAIGALQDPGTATTYYPIPIRALFVGDKTLGGYEAPDSNAIQWSFLPDWSDDLVRVIPEFNPLDDLVPASGD